MFEGLPKETLATTHKLVVVYVQAVAANGVVFGWMLRRVLDALAKKRSNNDHKVDSVVENLYGRRVERCAA